MYFVNVQLKMTNGMLLFVIYWNDKYETFEFDAVVSSNGHYHTPSLPRKIHQEKNLKENKCIHMIIVMLNHS